MSRGPTPRPLADRFDEKVDRTPGHGPWGDCHVWTGAHAKGYGQILVAHGKRGRAPRVAWFLATGEWPELHVLHRCDNPPCVRVDHLFLGTPADNTADMVAKGRAHGRPPKLTPAMRAAIAAWTGTQAEIARRLGVHQSTVSRARRAS